MHRGTKKQEVFCLLPAEMPVLKLLLLAFFWFLFRGDSMHRLSSNLARMRRPPSPYWLPKLKIFGGHLGNFGPKERQKRLSNLENAITISIFAPYWRIPWSKITKLTMSILLDGLHLNFNFGKIRLVNDGFITKKNFGTKKPRNLFLAPSAKTRDRIQK